MERDGDATDLFAGSSALSQFLEKLRGAGLPAPKAPAALTPASLTAAVSGSAAVLTAPSATKLDAETVLALAGPTAMLNDPRFDFSKYTEKEWAAMAPDILEMLKRPAGSSVNCAGCDFMVLG